MSDRWDKFVVVLYIVGLLTLGALSTLFVFGCGDGGGPRRKIVVADTGECEKCCDDVKKILEIVEDNREHLEILRNKFDKSFKKP